MNKPAITNRKESFVSNLWLSERCFSVIARLERNEHHARHVRHLILTPYYWWEISRCLPQMSNLRSVHFMNVYRHNEVPGLSYLPLPWFGAPTPSFRLTAVHCHQLEPTPELSEFFKSQPELRELTWYPAELDPALFFLPEAFPRLEVLSCTFAVADAWLSRRTIRKLCLPTITAGQKIFDLHVRANFYRVEILLINLSLFRPSFPFVKLKQLDYVPGRFDIVS